MTNISSWELLNFDEFYALLLTTILVYETVTIKLIINR